LNTKEEEKELLLEGIKEETESWFGVGRYD